MCKYIKDSKKAYTLAEILIVLVIIGVVAAMVLPTVNVNVQERKLSTGAAVGMRKIMEAVDTMSSLDRIGNLNNTTAFVNELRNHMKIVKTCNANNLTDCWGYDNITLDDNGTTYGISEATDGNAAFGMNGTDHRGRTADYSSNTVGFVTADGTPVVISYNTRCRKDGSETRNCFAAVFDVNGKNLPNRLGKDVIVINAKSFGASALALANNNQLDTDETSGAAGGAENGLWNGDEANNNNGSSGIFDDSTNKNTGNGNGSGKGSKDGDQKVLPGFGNSINVPDALTASKFGQWKKNDSWKKDNDFGAVSSKITNNDNEETETTGNSGSRDDTVNDKYIDDDDPETSGSNGAKHSGFFDDEVEENDFNIWDD